MKTASASQLLAARRSWIDAGKFRFQIERPTLLDVIRAGTGEAALSIEFAARFVRAWEGVTELDLVPGGDPDPPAFDPDLYVAWIADRPDLWKAIAEGIAAAYRSHEEKNEARGNA